MANASIHHSQNYLFDPRIDFPFLIGANRCPIGGKIFSSHHTCSMRNDGRANDQLREIVITRGFTKTPAGSVLWKQGETIVFCTASVTPGVPPWFKEDRAGGWMTADYVMLPGSTPQRKDWPRMGHTDSRGTEIQRIIGRSIRAIIDLSKIGPHTIHVDCQVLQADGGTRTASICAAYVALADAISKLPAQLPETDKRAAANANFYNPSHGLVDEMAAVSVGIIDGEIRLDLDYSDDSRALVDMNVAYTAGGKFVEVQGSAENGGGFDRAQMQKMMDLAVAGCEKLMHKMREARNDA
jgi:ribonuclease PH